MKGPYKLNFFNFYWIDKDDNEKLFFLYLVACWNSLSIIKILNSSFKIRTACTYMSWNLACNECMKV